MLSARPPRATPPLLKHLNERTVLETIRDGAPISRAEISRRAAISKPTVSLALKSLLGAGLVREAAPRPGRPSYGAVYFESVPEAALVLGLDVGARFVRGAICDLSGDIRARQDVELGAAGVDAALDTITVLGSSLLRAARLPGHLLDGAVVGVPGAVDDRGGEIHLATNVPGLEGRRFVAELRSRFGVPVAIENDINLAALGEHWQGSARSVNDFLFLSVGTGLGAGLVLRGELHRGKNGAAGELDFVAAGLVEDIDPCAAAVTLLAARLAAEWEGPTELRRSTDPRAIFQAARRGDPGARAVAREVARRIALHIVPVAAVADVELVVIGGGIGANGDLLLQPVRDLLADWLAYPPRVEISSLGDAAVLTGALSLGLQAALDNVFLNRSTTATGIP